MVKAALAGAAGVVTYEAVASSIPSAIAFSKSLAVFVSPVDEVAAAVTVVEEALGPVVPQAVRLRIRQVSPAWNK